MSCAAKILSKIFSTGNGANQLTTASVERSFSMLSKLLDKDRNFLSETIPNYTCIRVCVDYDSSTK